MKGEKRSVLITGCSSGIGYEAAHTLQRRGWDVIASARSADDVERLKSEGLTAVQLDLASPDSIAMAVDWTLKYTQGRLDALFNNGAFAIPAAVEDLSRSALAYQLENGFLGWHDLTRRVIPVMRAQGHGRIVQNSSVLGLVSMAYRGAYASMKFAVEGLSDAMRLELQGSGVRVSLIEPGPIVSEFRQNAYDEFRHWVDVEQSQHRQQYRQMIRRLQSEKREPFTLPPAAVVEKLIHALESPRPKRRYYVTKATWLMATLHRFLPTAWMDALLLSLARQEAKRYRQV